jgi:hypothetical protein
MDGVTNGNIRSPRSNLKFPSERKNNEIVPKGCNHFPLQHIGNQFPFYHEITVPVVNEKKNLLGQCSE